MANCWERTVPLAFHLCCCYFKVVLIVGIPFPFGAGGLLVWKGFYNLNVLGCPSAFRAKSIYPVCIEM